MDYKKKCLMDYKENIERYLRFRIEALQLRLSNVEPSSRYYVQDQIDELKFLLRNLDTF